MRAGASVTQLGRVGSWVTEACSIGTFAAGACGRKWPGAALVARTDLVAIGGKADAAGSRANVAIDPFRHFATVNRRSALGLPTAPAHLIEQCYLYISGLGGSVLAVALPSMLLSP